MIGRAVAVMMLALLVAAPASAGTAWVMWTEGRHTADMTSPGWTLVGAHEKRELCEAAIADDIAHAAMRLKKDGAVIVYGSRKVEGNPAYFVRVLSSGYAIVNADPSNQWVVTMKFSCLLDIIEPRGPKSSR